MRPPRPPNAARVRFDDLVGKIVAIRVTWSPAEPLRAELVDVIPVGRDVFLRIAITGRPKLINTRAVLELELGEGAV